MGGINRLRELEKIFLSLDGKIPAEITEFKAQAARDIQSAPLERLLGMLAKPDMLAEIQDLILKDERVVSLLLYSSSWLSHILPELNKGQLLSLSCADNIPKWTALAAEQRFQELTKSAAPADRRRGKSRGNESK
jgi:hypothetical protein